VGVLGETVAAGESEPADERGPERRVGQPGGWPERDTGRHGSRFRSRRRAPTVPGVPMNLLHRRICRSESWALRMHSQVLPWACQGVPLDGDVLEIGPGYGVTTRWLLDQGARVTAVEVDPDLAADLRRTLPGRVDVHTGDGAALPFPDAAFDTVVCFTMLHHVPSPEHQDRLLAEAARVLRPGGTFAGSDSRVNLRFRLLHIGDTMVAVDPARLPDRLRAVGFEEVHVDVVPRSLRFRATLRGEPR
jgi:SAM-dependent methyltransferase